MIDILISSYNGESFLKEQLDSIFSQTLQDFKILIRDDGSNDCTLRIINEYKEKYVSRISIINNNGRNLGSSNSFFELLHYSNGDYIFFCDQDDVWNPNKLELMLNYYNEKVFDKSKPVLIHSSAEVVDENLIPLPEQDYIFNKEKSGMEKSLCWQIFQNDVTGCTVLINSVMRNIVNDIDFTKQKIIQHDWFLAQIAYLSNSKYYISEKTIKYRQHSKNVIGIKKISFVKRIFLKFKNGIQYPFYDQVAALLQSNVFMDKEYRGLLVQFVSLREKNKIIRIIWHIKNHFYRDGSFIYRLYQLISC